jgi:glycine/D-amino acid oxidase-like deaminating enzyme
MQRRTFLKDLSAAAGMLALTGCTAKRPPAVAPSTAPAFPFPALPFYDAVPPIIPIRVHADRIFRITVCLRPFRAAGPRLDVERLGDKVVVHNYGHGGSGWSLSWGSSKIAVGKAFESGQPDGLKEIAVIGCGALGLTSAITAQRMGARVTIYCKERPPEVRSSRATGSWTPDSRIALAGSAAPEFPAQWEQMARTSWSTYQSYLGLPGDPIEFTDRYFLFDEDPDQYYHKVDAANAAAHSNRKEFASYAERIRDIKPRSVELPPGTHPFPTKYAYRNSSLTFNVADYSRQLMNDFLIAGGRIETAEFHTPADFASLPQRVLINCTGYGARQLWSDESIVPVRGQIAWLIPQEGVHYGLYYKDLGILARRDGIVVQGKINDDMEGYNETDETPNRADAEANLEILIDLYKRMAALPSRRT